MTCYIFLMETLEIKKASMIMEGVYQLEIRVFAVYCSLLVFFTFLLPKKQIFRCSVKKKNKNSIFRKILASWRKTASEKLTLQWFLQNQTKTLRVSNFSYVFHQKPIFSCSVQKILKKTKISKKSWASLLGLS